MTAPYLFVRRQKDVSPAQINRCGGCIVAVQSNRAPAYNRGREWWDAIKTVKTGFLWLPLPGMWTERQTREAIRFLGSVGAVAVVVNAEPRARGVTPRWEDGGDAEARRYMAIVRDEADKHGMIVGFTSWSRLSSRRRFPWAAFFEASDFSISQPYEVHGESGRAYVDACLAEYRAAGHDDVWCGRGAHELDKSDDDAWRTPVEIMEHRESTPPGAKEAWWLPRGRLPSSVLDAILADRGPAHASTEPPPPPFERASILALAERAKAGWDGDAAEAIRRAWVELRKG